MFPVGDDYQVHDLAVFYSLTEMIEPQSLKDLSEEVEMKAAIHMSVCKESL